MLTLSSLPRSPEGPKTDAIEGIANRLGKTMQQVTLLTPIRSYDFLNQVLFTFYPGVKCIICITVKLCEIKKRHNTRHAPMYLLDGLTHWLANLLNLLMSWLGSATRQSMVKNVHGLLFKKAKEARQPLSGQWGPTTPQGLSGPDNPCSLQFTRCRSEFLYELWKPQCHTSYPFT